MKYAWCLVLARKLSKFLMFIYFNKQESVQFTSLQAYIFFFSSISLLAYNFNSWNKRPELPSNFVGEDIVLEHYETWGIN